MKSEVALVTGCSSGIGRACADRLAATGFRVYGGSRRPVHGDGWCHVALDVTDEASISAAVGAILEREGRLDVLVHSAGNIVTGPVEETSHDEAARHFDVNYFGTVRTVRAVLPAMRRQGGGRIVVIGSVAGLIGLPFQAHYSAAKFALNGFVEGLRTELTPFGIDATIVLPGDHNTDIGVHRTVAGADQTTPYSERTRQFAEFYAASERLGPAPTRVATAIERLLRRRRLPVHVVVGSPLERFAVAGKKYLPATTFERLFRWAYGPTAD